MMPERRTTTPDIPLTTIQFAGETALTSITPEAEQPPLYARLEQWCTANDVTIPGDPADYTAFREPLRQFLAEDFQAVPNDDEVRMPRRGMIAQELRLPIPKKAAANNLSLPRYQRYMWAMHGEKIRDLPARNAAVQVIRYAEMQADRFPEIARAVALGDAFAERKLLGAQQAVTDLMIAYGILLATLPGRPPELSYWR